MSARNPLLAALLLGFGVMAAAARPAAALPPAQERLFRPEQIEAARAEDREAPPMNLEGSCIVVSELPVAGGDWCPIIFNNDDTAHYVRGTTLIWHILVNHAGASFSDGQIDNIGSRSTLARQYYMDHAPSNAWVRFDHEDDPGFYYFNPTLPYEIVVNGAHWGDWVNDACQALGVADSDGDGYYSDDLTILLQAWGGGWDNVIAVFQPAGLFFRANASVERGACQVGYSEGWTTYAHEWGHCFGSCDEYEENGSCNGHLCDWVCQSCYLTDDVPNGNCEANPCTGSVTCIMKYDVPGGLEPPCEYTVRNWAWVDGNEDGLLDTTLWNDAGTAQNLYELYHNGYFIHTNTDWGMVASERWTSWSAIGVRSRGTSDYQIDVYGDNNFRWWEGFSQKPGQEVDFVVGDGNHNNLGQDFIKLRKVSGNGQYVLSFESGNQMLYPDGVERAGNWNDTNVVRVWDVPLIAGEKISFFLDMDTPGLDLGMALFRSNGSSYYAGRAGAEWEEDDWPAGLSEEYTYTVPATDVYGLVVWANSEVDGDFTIQIGPTIQTLPEADPATTFLDLRLYRYSPYTDYWAVSAARPGENTNLRLQLYGDATFQDLLATSGAYPGVEFIAADYNPGWSTDYLRVLRQSGVNSYATEWEQGPDLLSGFYSASWGAEHIAKVWDAHLLGGQPYLFRQYESLASPIDAGIYVMSSADGNRYVQRSGAAAGSAGHGGAGEWFLYTPPADDWYGFVMITNDEDSSGPYTVGVGPRVSLTPKVPQSWPDELVWADIPASSTWSVAAVRPGSGSESEAHLWDCESYANSCYVTGDLSLPGLRYVVVDGEYAPGQTFYPRFERTVGTGAQTISCDNAAGQSIVFDDPGQVEIAEGTFGSHEVAQVWALSARVVPIRQEIIVTPLVTGLDVGVSLHRSGPVFFAQGSNEALEHANDYGAGAAERIVVDITAGDIYGLVVTNENGVAGGYRIQVRDADAPAGAGEPALPTQLSFRITGAMPSAAPTVFELALPSDADVDLSVFDVHGRRVRSLETREMQAGRYSFTWDGRDDGGHSASGGLYFVRLVAGAEKRTVKVIRPE
ncbi:MAG: FlgD immunoglobulin-like domain containing protein [Candidatus Eisenbacteria bacterium]|nr:FlgD immunoglobulin-like domain containing protein [Candidatus Eisenbacteria bacterium]